MFCEKCATELTNNTCLKCGFIKFHNPIPVAVALVPIEKDGKTFLLGVKRGIAPQKGHMALPGGFQEIEEIKTTLCREVLEECDLKVTVDESKSPVVFSSEPIPNRLLVFFTTQPVKYDSVNWTFSNEETEKLDLLDENSKLAFPLHEKAVQIFYKNLKG